MHAKVNTITIMLSKYTLTKQHDQKHAHMQSQGHERTHMLSYMCTPSITHAHLISVKGKVQFFCGCCLEQYDTSRKRWAHICIFLGKH